MVMCKRRSYANGIAFLSPLLLLWATASVHAQVMSKWGHPVFSFGWTPYDVTDPGMGNYPGSPGFIPGYGYYPGPGPGTYPWMDAPGTPFDRRKIWPPYLASPPYGTGWTSPVEEGQPPPGAALII